MELLPLIHRANEVLNQKPIGVRRLLRAVVDLKESLPPAFDAELCHAFSVYATMDTYPARGDGGLKALQKHSSAQLLICVQPATL